MDATESEEDRVSIDSAESATARDSSPLLSRDSSYDPLMMDEAHGGVEAIEASYKVYTSFSKFSLFAGLALAAYIYSLDSSTTWTYLSFAASEFGDHGLIASIQVAQGIVVAVGKPVIAKTADVGSRGTAFFAVSLFYVAGYIVIAFARGINGVAGGIVLYSIGYTGLQVLNSILIADITTLQWRALVNALVSSPFLINVFVGANVSAAVLANAGWRWGYGMFAILVPIALTPIIATLLWGERKTRRIRLREQRAFRKVDELPLTEKLAQLARQLDLVGLVILGAALALFLLPFTLAPKATNRWSNPSMIGMLATGIALFPVFAYWEAKHATHPVVPRRFIMNRALMTGAFIGFFDFVSYYLLQTYLYSFIYVTKTWSLVNINYFNLTQIMALTVFAILTGAIMRVTHRYRVLLIVGVGIRLAGTVLMIHSRGAQGSDFEIVGTQLMQGAGGGIAAISSLVAAQASVTHGDVATATAFILLLTEIGGAFGGAISGGIWTTIMPGRLRVHLPDLSESQIQALFGDIVQVKKNPQWLLGAIAAYDDTMRMMCITGAFVAIIPFILAFSMPDLYLGDSQNAVTETGLDGAYVNTPEHNRLLSESHRH